MNTPNNIDSIKELIKTNTKIKKSLNKTANKNYKLWKTIKKTEKNIGTT